MKKLTVIILAVATLLSLTSCAGFIEGFKEGFDQAIDDAIEDANKDLARGTVTDKVYTSEYNGITFTAPEGWRYYTDTELADLMNVSFDQIDMNAFNETAAKMVSVYDMLAMNETTGTNVIVMYENLAMTGNKNMTEEKYYEAAKSTLAQQGFTAGELSETTLGGEKFFCYKITVETITQYMYLRTLGDYMCIVNITVMGSETQTEIEALFS